jgi:hypothetical protein
MDGIVERIPQVLQAIFGEVADTAARTTKFVQRERGFSGSDFVRALVFGWLACPESAIEPLADELGITGPGLQQRLTKSASDTLWTVLKSAVELLLASRVATIPLLAKFNGVYAEDCSNIALPTELAEQFPGCGNQDGQSGKAALRLFACYELKTGKLQELATAQARGIDAVVAQQHAPALPAGALRLRDMGFFDRQLLTQDDAAGVFWISRLPACLTVQPAGGDSLPVSEFLESQDESVHSLDCELWVGQAGKKSQPMKCRFIAVRCPPEVAARRRQKVHETARRKGKTASQRQLTLCDWTVLITNVPAEKLSIRDTWELYCTRWQIELLFKRWKSLGGIQVSTKWKAERVLCELYAKLLGMLVSHWFTLIRGGPLAGFSLTKAIQRIKQYATCIAEALALGCSELLIRVVARIAKLIARLPKQQRRTKHPSTRQRLFKPRLKT